MYDDAQVGEVRISPTIRNLSGVIYYSKSKITFISSSSRIFLFSSRQSYQNATPLAFKLFRSF